MTGLLEVCGLEKRFDGVRALVSFACTVRSGEILGIIGPNGAGKTTLFNVVSGFVVPDSGRIMFRGREILGFAPHRIARLGISRTFQSLRLVRQISVLENVLLSYRGQMGETLGSVFFKWRQCQRQEDGNRREALALLADAGLAHKVDDPAEELSYGQQKLLSLVCCLAAKPDVLLLDEPVAGIASEMTERILKTIRGLPAEGKSVVLIEHNLDAVMQVCDRVIFMDAGAKVCEGTPDEVRNDPRVIEAYIN